MRRSETALNSTTPLTGVGSQARLQSVTGGPGEGIQFGYAANASLLESVNYQASGSTWIGRSQQYDFLNRLKQISTQFGDTHNYEFDALNRRKKDTLGDGSRWDYAYDQLGQLTNAVKFDVGGATSLNNRFSYTADGIGNVLSAQSPTVGGGRVCWPGGSLEISQPRQWLVCRSSDQVPDGTEEGAFVRRPFRTRCLAGTFPATKWLANFPGHFVTMWVHAGDGHDERGPLPGVHELRGVEHERDRAGRGGE